MSKKTIIYTFMFYDRTASDTSISDADMKKICDSFGAHDAEVRIIQSNDWNPPEMNSIEHDLDNEILQVFSRIGDYLTIHKLHPDLDEIAENLIFMALERGLLIKDPISGRAYMSFPVIETS